MNNPTARVNIVLYADDDIDDLELVKESLEQYSDKLEVKTVMDGAQALAFLNHLTPFDEVPCLIILDINMPILNGKETLIELRKMEKFSTIPVVLFTTSSQPLDKSFALKHNAGFITKPIGVKQMEVIADQFIEHCAEEVRKNIRRQIQ